MNIIVVDESNTQILQLVTNHSRWSEAHRNICDDCRSLYEDELDQLEYTEECY